MHLEAFLSLGRIIDKKYRQANYDDRQFPEIAEKALRDWEPPAFHLAEIPEFLLSTPIKQQPRTEFSNLPVTVFHSPEFYIELLIWTDATTAIHQHGFCGAFQVLLGSSLHSEYDFVEEDRVSSLLLLGKVHLQSLAPLAVGDVRQINSGRSGLVHSLYHLEEPSVTLVVRTHGEPWAQPQYSLCPPTVAAAMQILEKDARVQLACRVIDVLQRLSAEEAIEVWCQSTSQLDFPRLFAICLRLTERPAHSGLKARLLSSLVNRNEKLAKHLEYCCAERSRVSSLTSARASVTDPELRFFLALLLNARTRRNIWELVEHRYPTRSPVECCIAWLKQLADPTSLLKAAHAAGELGGTEGAPSQFALKLVREQRRIRAEAMDPVWRAIVCGERTDLLEKRLVRICDGSEAQSTIAAYRRCRELSELAVFTTD